MNDAHNAESVRAIEDIIYQAIREYEQGAKRPIGDAVRRILALIDGEADRLEEVQDADLERVRCRCGYTIWVPLVEVSMHRRAFEKWCPHGPGGVGGLGETPIRPSCNDAPRADHSDGGDGAEKVDPWVQDELDRMD